MVEKNLKDVLKGVLLDLVFNLGKDGVELDKTFNGLSLMSHLVELVIHAQLEVLLLIRSNVRP